MTTELDKRALKILLDTFWSSGGWRSATKNSKGYPSNEDIAYARSAGYILEEVTLTHQQGVARVVAAMARLQLETVADAFLASLSTRRMDWRSALGSYVALRHLQPHDEVPTSPNASSSSASWASAACSERRSIRVFWSASCSRASVICPSGGLWIWPIRRAGGRVATA